MATPVYYSVRNSKIHGRGVFAKRPIRKGTRIIEYTGPIISAKEADQIGEQKSGDHSHTMLFSIDKKRVINGNEGGSARYINHSCEPNAEAVQDGDQVFIEALRAIKTGEEITYDYHLQVEGKITAKEKKEFACFCGKPSCRGTQIAAEILEAQAKRDAKKAAKEEAKRLKKEQKKANKASKADKKKSGSGKKKKAKSEKKVKADKKADTKTKTKKKDASKPVKKKSNKKVKTSK